VHPFVEKVPADTDSEENNANNSTTGETIGTLHRIGQANRIQYRNTIVPFFGGAIKPPTLVFDGEGKFWRKSSIITSPNVAFLESDCVF